MITLHNIKVTFSPGTVLEREALKGISLKISEGEFITVIGSNGAGKSTLLHTVAGEVLPRSGTLKIDGQDVTRMPAYRRAAFVARVFQDPLAGTCGDLTVAENLAIAEHRGKTRTLSWGIPRYQRRFYQDLLADLDLGLESRLDTPVASLSGGQRQAVSLIMATLSPLKILLLDEHVAALDPKTAAYVMELTAKIIEEKKLTVLMVTHSLHQALHMGSRTIMLHNGKVIYDVTGEMRATLTVADLLAQFGNAVDDDRLLLQ